MKFKDRELIIRHGIHSDILMPVYVWPDDLEKLTNAIDERREIDVRLILGHFVVMKIHGMWYIGYRETLRRITVDDTDISIPKSKKRVPIILFMDDSIKGIMGHIYGIIYPVDNIPSVQDLQVVFEYVKQNRVRSSKLIGILAYASSTTITKTEIIGLLFEELPAVKYAKKILQTIGLTIDVR